MKELILRIFTFLASVFTAKKWGEAEAERDTAEQIAEERAEDARITSKPYESNPFGRMRRKKD